MWNLDQDGTELPGPKAAFEALRRRALQAIAQGDRHGFDVRQVRIRVRDEAGAVLFEGTTEEAASLQIDGRVTLPRKPPPGSPTGGGAP